MIGEVLMNEAYCLRVEKGVYEGRANFE